MTSLHPMAPAHGASVAAIQQSIYPPSLHEDVALILERAALFPRGSLVCICGQQCVGYASAYPYPEDLALARPPSLGKVEPLCIARALAEPARACLFIHEISIYSQGQGLGQRVLQELLAVAAAHSFRSIVLVSVLGNENWYARSGFRVVRELASYSCDEGASAATAPPPPLPPTPSYHCQIKQAHVMHLAL